MGFRTFFPGSRLVYTLYLGDATPLGGTLKLTTCGHTANNTVLYVGTGCPTWERPFGCLVGNDNAVAGSCSVNPAASALSITATQTNYFIQVGGNNGADVVSGLQWTYVPPVSATANATRSGTCSRSRSATRSRSGPISASRSRKRKR